MQAINDTDWSGRAHRIKVDSGCIGRIIYVFKSTSTDLASSLAAICSSVFFSSFFDIFLNCLLLNRNSPAPS